jgi:hypothetical protein
MGSALNATPALPPPPVKAVCAPRADMCDTSAPAGRAAFCKATKPFESSKCVGGCCVSSGKCKFGSCAANGLGKDVAMACFGNNAIPSPLALLGNKCGHLACKLAVPGCKSALMGGNCVGTVVATKEASKLHPQAAKYLGHPCVEITPTGGVIDVKGIDVGLPAREYVIAAWKVCDCVDPSALPKEGESFPVVRATMIPKPQIKLPKFGRGSSSDEVAGPGKLAMMRDLIAGSMSKDTKDPFADFMSSEEAAAPAAAAEAEPAAEQVTDSEVEGVQEPAAVPESAAVAASEAEASEAAAPEAEASEAAESEAAAAAEAAPSAGAEAPAESEGAEAAAPAPEAQEQPAPEAQEQPAPAAPEAPPAEAPAPAAEAEIDPFNNEVPPPDAAPVEPEGTFDPSAPENMQAEA